MPERPACLPYLQLAIMLLLRREGRLCGYRIYRLLREAGLEVDEAAVYSALRKLRERGLVEVAERGPRGRLRYRLTERGVEELERLVSLKRLVDEALKRLGSGATNNTPIGGRVAGDRREPVEGNPA